MNITIIERGWPAHFICCHDCVFHRNTLLTHPDGRMIIVSTVGNRRDHRDTLKMVMVDENRNLWYETKIFVAHKEGPYIDPDICRQLHLEDAEKENAWGFSADTVDKLPDDIDNIVNAAHDRIVATVEHQFDQIYH